MEKTEYQRVIGSYEGTEKGPLFICFGAMHGNEPAGLRAIELVLKMLEIEPIKNRDFSYKGKFVGLIGNLKALKIKKRFIDKDLNRKFIESEIRQLLNATPEDLVNEDRELYDLLQQVQHEIDIYKPSKLIFLDLHTTSSYGGIFTICRNQEQTINLAYGLHAPVVLGMLDGLQGTTLHYFTTENMGIETTALTFESGQHEETLSVNRAIAGIICCMREVGSVSKDDVENYHEDILIEYSKTLPKLTKMVERHEIQDTDHFQMLPGYKNFQQVTKGELLAKNILGDVHAQEDGLLLMPLYQKQGEEGFFIIKELN